MTNDLLREIRDVNANLKQAFNIKDQPITRFDRTEESKQ